MPEPKPNSAILIRSLQGFEDMKKAEALEREVWELSDLDVTPTTLAIATQQAGSIWLGALDGDRLVGFAFGFLGLEDGKPSVHSHMLAVQQSYRNSDL